MHIATLREESRSMSTVCRAAFRAIPMNRMEQTAKTAQSMEAGYLVQSAIDGPVPHDTPSLLPAGTGPG